MISFSHGSGPLSPSPMPKLQIITGTQIMERIDAGLQREREEIPERDYIGASELGDECLRAVYLNAIKARAEPFTGQKLRIFKMGHVFEDMMAEWLRLGGFHLQPTDLETGKQFEFVTGHGLIKGHSDGVIVDGPPIDGLSYPCLWENKALKNSSWNKFFKGGVRKADPKYFAQAQLYMGYFGLQICLFTAVNKDTAEIYHEVIPYQVEVAQYYSDRGVKLIRSLQGGFMPRRPYANRQHMRCRMCQRADYCWGVAA